MKKIIINEDILRQIIAEMAKERKLVTEIKVADAYTRFYQDKIPQDIYSALMKGTDKMTPFHKLCLDVLVKNVSEDSETNDMWHDQYLEWAKEIGDKWAVATNDARQFLLRYIQSTKPIYSFDNFERIVMTVNKILNKSGHTEKNYSKRGLVVLYQDDNLLITCTTSYAASKETYGDSHWCTASDVFGRYNGFKMFGEYTCNSEYEDDAILVQFVDKHEREKTIQVAFSEGLGIVQACDFFDNQLETQETIDYLNKIIGIDRLREIIPWDDLMEQTRDLFYEEYEYWEEKVVASIEKVSKSLKEKVKNGEFEQTLLKAINEAIEKQWFNYTAQNGVHISFGTIPDHQKSLGNYVCTVSYYGEYYENINDFEESNDVEVHPVETVLIKQGTNGDYYIAERVPDMYIFNSPLAFVTLTNSGRENNLVMACRWSDFSVIAKGFDAINLTGATALLDRDFHYFSDEPYNGIILNNYTGEMLYKGTMTRIGLWDSVQTVYDVDGNCYSAQNGWTKI